ncbi:MAG: competence protein ComEA [Chloroflexota bacterium]|nr:competence protein ComEA [Chloroflexota bacterium]
MGAAAVGLVTACALLAWHLAASPAGAESIAAEALRARGAATPAAPQDAAAAAASKPLQVYVSGAVVHPGMYQLPRGARLADAIDAAGGLLPDADPNKLPNLAGRLTDGKQVKVARRGATSAAASRVDINVATVEELLAVPGVDQQLADAIVNERDEYGPFYSLTDLHDLLGLDATLVAALRPYLTVVIP